MNNVIIQDTLELYLQGLGTSKKEYFFALTTNADISQQIKQDVLRAGIGNGAVSTIQSDKDITLKITNLLHCDDFMEIQQGTEFENSISIPVHFTEEIEAEESGKITVENFKNNENRDKWTSAILILPNGENKNVTINVDEVGGAKITDEDIKAGEIYKVVYNAEKVGNVLDIDAKTFPKYFYAEAHTIAYDTVSNEVVADIYWIFNKMLPDGKFSTGNKAGENTPEEMTLKAMTGLNSSSYGKYVVIPRKIK